jgi:ABC-type spermidine/putrescine transport system permease subunit II
VAIPVISFALALYICLVRLHLADTLLGLIGAHCVLCTPVTFGLAAASLARRAPFLEEAALNLGASRTQTWLLVTLPSIRNAILASLLLSFAVSFNEVVAVVFLSDVEVITVSKRLWDGIRFEISPILAAASVLTLAVAVPAVISFDILASRALLSARKDE